jgi:hypothetical protein
MRLEYWVSSMWVNTARLSKANTVHAGVLFDVRNTVLHKSDGGPDPRAGPWKVYGALHLESQSRIIKYREACSISFTDC